MTWSSNIDQAKRCYWQMDYPDPPPKVIDLDVKVDFVQFSTEKLTQIRQATNADPIVCELRVRILQGWLESRRELHKDLQPFWSYRDELPIEKGILLKGDRILIPKSMQTETLEKFIMVTKEATNASSEQKCVFWSGINSDIDKIVQQCAICQELQKSQSAESLVSHEIPVRPWQIVATDIFTLNRHNYLLIVDYNSKYPFIRELREFSSKEVIHIIKQIFAEQEVPERLISDNGPHFSSHQFKEFAKGWDFEHIPSSPKYPQSNGRTVHTDYQGSRKDGHTEQPRHRHESAVPPIASNGSCNPSPWSKRGNSGAPTPQRVVAEKTTQPTCKGSIQPQHRATSESTSP